jgi:membrane protease YdiL (CAAX protease family)
MDLNVILNLGVAVVFALLAVLAHLAWDHKWARWVFYGLSSLYCLGLVGVGSFLVLMLLSILSRPELAEKITKDSGTATPIDVILGGTALTFFLLALGSLLIILPWTRKFIFKVVGGNPQSIPHVMGMILFLLTGTYFLLSTTILYDQEAILAQLKNVSLVSSAASVFCGMLIVVAGGVGLFVRRGWKAALARLGVMPLTQIQLASCAAFGVLLVGGVMALNAFVIQPFMPETVEMNKAFDEAMHLKGETWQVILGSLAVALCAGIGEELMFRGLLQPAYGLWPAAILFALTHSHYGPSVLILQILLLGVLFGVIRKYYNTTGAMVTHATFDLTVLILSSVFRI